MAYATIHDLILRFGQRDLVQLTDRADPPAGLVDEQVASDALTFADNLINGHLAGSYKLPLSGVHQLLKDLALDIAWWRLHREPHEDVRRLYDAAKTTLKQLSEGKLKLSGEDGTGEPIGRDDVLLVESGERLFSRKTMRGL